MVNEPTADALKPPFYLQAKHHSAVRATASVKQQRRQQQGERPCQDLLPGGVAARAADRAMWGSAGAAQAAQRSPLAVAGDRKALRMARLAGFEVSTDFLDG